jgi:hypothetical protein
MLCAILWIAGSLNNSTFLIATSLSLQVILVMSSYLLYNASQALSNSSDIFSFQSFGKLIISSIVFKSHLVNHIASKYSALSLNESFNVCKVFVSLNIK